MTRTVVATKMGHDRCRALLDRQVGRVDRVPQLAIEIVEKAECIVDDGDEKSRRIGPPRQRMRSRTTSASARRMTGRVEGSASNGAYCCSKWPSGGIGASSMMGTYPASAFRSAQWTTDLGARRRTVRFPRRKHVGPRVDESAHDRLTHDVCLDVDAALERLGDKTPDRRLPAPRRPREQHERHRRTSGHPPKLTRAPRTRRRRRAGSGWELPSEPQWPSRCW